MSYITDLLSPKERILFSLPLHWSFYVRKGSYIIFAIAIWFIGSSILENDFGISLDVATGAIAADEKGWNNLIGVIGYLCIGLGALQLTVMGVWHLLRGLLFAWSTQRVVTSRRVIFKKGLFRLNIDELNVSRIEEVNIKQSIVDRIFDTGTITLAGLTGESAIKLDCIKDPISVRNKLDELYLQTRGKSLAVENEEDEQHYSASEGKIEPVLKADAVLQPASTPLKLGGVTRH